LALTACASDSEADHDRSTTTVDRSPYDLVVTPAARLVGEAAGVDVGHALRRMADRVFGLLPHEGRISIRAGVDAARTIPEVGFGGFTNPGTGDVFVWLAHSPPAAPTAASFRRWLHATLAHELHHSSRIRSGPGYGTHLGEALVTEGLADSFALEIVRGAPTLPWDSALTIEERVSTWLPAREALWSGYDHDRWFFGHGDLPRWAGYSLGFDAVQQYLDAGQGRTAATSVAVDAHEVLDDYEP